MGETTLDKNHDEKNNKKKKVNKNAGHRDRVRKRYYENGINSLSEHEILELLLFYAIPMKDTKEKAKDLIEKMGGFSNVFDADIDELMKSGEVTFNIAVLIKLINDINKKYEESKYRKRVRINCTDDANKYIRSIIKYEAVENLIVVCLNNEREIIGHDIIARGTINEVVVYTREILQVAFKHKAVSLIIGHNHPSGNPLPSSEDIEMTNKIYKALAYSGVRLSDHIIIGDKEEKYYSFYGNKKIDKEI